MEYKENQLLKHYKGGYYKILKIGIHTETLEECVVYTEYPSSINIWIRPIKMFEETVNYKGKEVKRFTRV